MGNIHIIDESDTLLLMPCGTVWVIIVDWNLSGVICHGYWQFAARIMLPAGHLPQPALPFPPGSRLL